MIPRSCPIKPYQRLPILECGEPLVPIPLGQFLFQQPHPYQRLGAPYGGASPFYLRQGVLNHLCQAQEQLQQRHPNWRIQIFDAYRPVAVQQFMVDYTLAEMAQAQGLNLQNMTEAEHQAILEQVYQIWAMPSLDPATPPPHSTGAAVDVTLVDSTDKVVFMGSPIDELSQRSHPAYFAAIAANPNLPQDERDAAHTADRNRQLLGEVMVTAGFQRHPGEWWHFSWGDQLWAWLNNQQFSGAAVARYGRVESGIEASG